MKINFTPHIPPIALPANAMPENSAENGKEAQKRIASPEEYFSSRSRNPSKLQENFCKKKEALESYEFDDQFTTLRNKYATQAIDNQWAK